MALHIGSIAPDFSAESTLGTLSFHQWLGDSWGILCSHPADFTPVCTTELGRAAHLVHEFSRRNTKLVALSTDSLADHKRWLTDIERTQSARIEFPIVADPERVIAPLYDLIHQESGNTETIRSVFFIDPAKRVRATLHYPANTGRNFDEILRLLDSLQLTDRHSVATPADWQDGDDVVIVPALTDSAELQRRFPSGYRSIRPYLRFTSQPET
ncbi:MAG TPA: peroxiredoxin [Polyangiaceae bacterium]|nr:peroxiredoxin [Polyangiaceae bacterium]